MIDMTVIGSVKRRQALTRSGARPGDDVFVTGSMGAAAAGLEMLRSGKAPESCAERYLYPEPRVRAGVLLARNRAASSCIDLSDGLADGIRQIAEASGVGAVIDAAALPISAAARKWFEQSGLDPVVSALAGGDDYELLLAVPRRARGRFATVQRQAGSVPLTRIGEITEARELTVRRGDRDEPLPSGFVHF